MKLFIFLWISLLTIQSALGFETRCGNAQTEDRAYSWCIHNDPQSTNPHVLYYLHGLGGSEKNWKNLNAYQQLRGEWKRQGYPLPTVVSVSFGKAWLLTQVPRGDRKGLYDLFIQNILPELEKSLPRPFSKRFLMGESMGGFNSSQLLLKNGSLFTRVALLCPAIPTLSPYASEKEVDEFLQRNQPYVDPYLVGWMRAWGQQEFPTAQDWNQHDPIALSSRLTPQSPRLYVSCGKRDEFGFFEGSDLFARNAFEQNVRVRWVPLPGEHCVIDPVSVAHFFSEPE